MTASLTQSAPLGRRMIRRVDMTRVPPGEIQHAVFDFDGTLSLLRVGWQQIHDRLLRRGSGRNTGRRI
ncbi:MAG TPA: hypothetical protein QF604_00635 [Candidatus Latescibacteria bacterium]|nr:hypothetical protein [Candidatus Latescibacterota bacterium]HJN26399.1 hypothetical protein [Candidatus Latescibacterota bacterium]